MQSDRKPSNATEVMVGMFPFSCCCAEKAELLATAGFVLGPASMSVGI